MVEFSEDFNTRYTGKQALLRRVEARLFVERGSIPFSNYGIDYGLFTFSNADFKRSVNKMFADMKVNISVGRGRITVADLSFNIGTDGVIL